MANIHHRICRRSKFTTKKKKKKNEKIKMLRKIGNATTTI